MMTPLGGSWAVLGLAALVIVQRLAELRIARKHEAWARAQGAVEHGRDHYPWFFLLHGGWLVAWIAEGWRAGSGLHPLYAAIWLLLQLARVWVIRSLGPYWNTRILIVPGAEPIRRGPYRWLKHPNYVVVAAEMIVTPLAVGAPWTAFAGTLANAVMMAVRIPAENRALATMKPVVLAAVVASGLVACATPPMLAGASAARATIEARLDGQPFPHGSVRIISTFGDELARLGGHSAAEGKFAVTWPDEGLTVALVLDGTRPDGSPVMVSALLRTSGEKLVDEATSVICEKALSRSGGLGPQLAARLTVADLDRLETAARAALSPDEARRAATDGEGFASLFPSLLARSPALVDAWRIAGGN
ncbi:MAG: isoprenylcysteine carboxyl methyltransferase family protein [Candidatus Sericytochromatia bacterium]|nr:isoprenylcysteine carboxyl methyltransferase family protein [Candidatus Sericytochromatia bacterium]